LMAFPAVPVISCAAVGRSCCSFCSTVVAGIPYCCWLPAMLFTSLLLLEYLVFGCQGSCLCQRPCCCNFSAVLAILPFLPSFLLLKYQKSNLLSYQNISLRLLDW
jgi:hypothetical protein